MKVIEKAGMNEPVEEEKEKKTYFFDTYALFEIIYGSPNYKIYSDALIITTIFNLTELNYNLKKEMPKEKADSYTEDYKDFLANVSLEDIKAATDIKVKHKNMSIPDVIGYVVAKRLGVKFLTGDSDFEGMENVEFVKK